MFYIVWHGILKPNLQYQEAHGSIWTAIKFSYTRVYWTKQKLQNLRQFYTTCLNILFVGIRLGWTLKTMNLLGWIPTVRPRFGTTGLLGLRGSQDFHKWGFWEPPEPQEPQTMNCNKAKLDMCCKGSPLYHNKKIFCETACSIQPPCDLIFYCR